MFSGFRKLLSGGQPASGEGNYPYRRSVYAAELGEPDHIFADSEPDGIEILAYGRDFSPTDDVDEGYVLLTNGMSDRRMAVPSNVSGNAARRAELMWYVREPTPDIIANLRWLAKFPFIDDTWLGFGHRIPMPQPPVSGSDFRTFLFLSPIIAPDQRLAEELMIEKDEVDVLTVHLISGTEYQLIKTAGLDPFLDMLDENDYPAIFDPQRTSYL